uniref:Uncharacterized protein n=1 Tax=Arundo donax TaxID=35708 RepID=A0A0A9ELE8_ARUDO
MTATQEAMTRRCDFSCLNAASLLGRRGIAPRNILIPPLFSEFDRRREFRALEAARLKL